MNFVLCLVMVFPKLLILKLWEKSVEDLEEYTMLILEIVERPLQFVIEVEVGGKW